MGVKHRYKNVVIVGASGALGKAFVEYFACDLSCNVYALSRAGVVSSRDNVFCIQMNWSSEVLLGEQLMEIAEGEVLDCVVIATGILHGKGISPEKSLKDISFKQMQDVFSINTLFPALVAKYLLPRLNKHRRSMFIVLSARVGSIADNRLGGWYAYRASKAALNMLLKTASIEMARRNKQAVVLGLHPGTVDSDLSRPYQKNLVEGQLLTPIKSVEKMMALAMMLTAEDSGGIFAWSGERIEY